jgi:hypothetical protein
MPKSDFYQAEPLAEMAINLFHGWGYNFYRLENQLRADDLLIRAKAATLLGQARASVEAAEAAFRRSAFPAPTRDRPFADSKTLAEAQALEQLSQGIGALAARLHALPAPENDRMTQRYRLESTTLRHLASCDELLIGQAELLRAKLNGQDAAAILATATMISFGLAAIQETLRNRQTILSDPE